MGPRRGGCRHREATHLMAHTRHAHMGGHVPCPACTIVQRPVHRVYQCTASSASAVTHLVRLAHAVAEEERVVAERIHVVRLQLPSHRCVHDLEHMYRGRGVQVVRLQLPPRPSPHRSTGHPPPPPRTPSACLVTSRLQRVFDHCGLAATLGPHSLTTIAIQNTQCERRKRLIQVEPVQPPATLDGCV
jgi:hypothetical protein